MAKVGDKVKFSPDRGNENPNGKTIHYGMIIPRYDESAQRGEDGKRVEIAYDETSKDETFDIKLENGVIKTGVSEGNKLGQFKGVGKKKDA